MQEAGSFYKWVRKHANAILKVLGIIIILDIIVIAIVLDYQLSHMFVRIIWMAWSFA